MSSQRRPALPDSLSPHHAIIFTMVLLLSRACSCSWRQDTQLAFLSDVPVWPSSQQGRALSSRSPRADTRAQVPAAQRSAMPLSDSVNTPAPASGKQTQHCSLRGEAGP